MGGVPTLLWKLIDEINLRPRRPPTDTATEIGCADWEDTLTGLLLGAFISEGFVSKNRAGFNNLDRDYFNNVVAAYDAVVGGPATSERRIASGLTLLELDVHNLEALASSPLQGHRSASCFDRIWNATSPVKRAFLQALFEGDGSCSALPRNTIQVSRPAATGSRRMSSSCCSSSALSRGATSTPPVSTRSSSPTAGMPRRSFPDRVRRNQHKLLAILRDLPRSRPDSIAIRSLGWRHSSERTAVVAGSTRLRKHNIDRLSRWQRSGIAHRGPRCAG